MSRRTIMILGAGPFQVPAVRRARALGYRVITVDNLPGNPGHRHSDEQVMCSTSDVEGVVRAARQSCIDGIVSMASDVAVDAWAQVACDLDLMGPPRTAAKTMTNKDIFRRFQSEHGLSTPMSFNAFALTEFRDLTGRFESDFVVKPAATSGSRGISVLSPGQSDGLLAAFELAKKHSRNGMVCIEELVHGEDVTAEGFVQAGRIVSMEVTRKIKVGFAPVGHVLPGVLSSTSVEFVSTELERTFRYLAYQDGPFDADVRVAEDRVTIMEVSPRLGGNGVPLVVGYYMGVDLIDTCIRIAMGETPRFGSGLTSRSSFGSTILRSDKSGTVRRIRDADVARSHYVGFRDLYWAVAPGEAVSRFEHGGHTLGYGIFEIANGNSYEEAAGQVRRAVGLEVV